MFDEKNHDRNDALGERLRRIGGQMNPSPELKKAAKTGVPLRPAGIQYTAGAHIRRVSKAVLAYAAGVVILLGCVFLLPRMFGEGGPVATVPKDTTTTSATTTTRKPPATTYEDYPIPPHVIEPFPPYGSPYTENSKPVSLTTVLEGKVNLRQLVDLSSLHSEGMIMWHGDEGLALWFDGKLNDRCVDAGGEGGICSCGELWDYANGGQIYFSLTQKVTLEAYVITTGVSGDRYPLRFPKGWKLYATNDPALKIDEWTLLDYLYEGNIQDGSAVANGYEIMEEVRGAYQHYCFVIDYSDTGKVDLAELELYAGADSGITPPPADCEHMQDPATCPYCNCDGHEFADNTCTKCGLVCEHEYSDVFHNGICTLCGTECNHVYNEDTCDGVCTLCQKRQGHDYETVISTEHICTEGTLTTTTCRRCGYSYTETTPAKGHSYENGVCTVCGEKQKTVIVTDSKVAAGSVSLLPGQMYSTYPSLQGDGFYGLDPTTTPVYYNVYTYFEGYTITNIRLPIYRAEKGSVFTVRVMRTNNGINTEWVATYTLPINREVSREWVLLSGFSIKVPEGCTLTFGWTSDDIELAMPTSGYIPGYSYCNDYAGSCGTVPLLIDVYGKKTTPPPTPDACEHDPVITGQTPTCTEGCTVKYTCSKCGYSYEQWKDPVVHDYRNGACTMCGRAEAVVTAGSANLLLSERAYSISTAMKVNYFALANSGAPYYFRSNYYTDPNALLEGSTVTDIRVAVLSANKGDTLTVSVVRMNGNVPGETLKTYVLTAAEKMEWDCLLFSGLSIEVPVGYTLIFGAPDDTVELIYTDNTLLSHTFASTVRGEFENDYALMIDVYGVRDLDGTLHWMEKLGCPGNLLPNAVRPLNASEIDAARTFLNGDARWIITEETFFKPEDIRPYMLFYMENGTDRLSDGEFEALKAIRGDVVIWGDCSKMTDAELDAYLMQYMGIEMEPSMIGKRLYYLEEYDSYYFFATDANDIGVSNLWGWLTEDGNYLLRSTAGYNDFAVLLKPTADGFLIQQVVWIHDWIHWVD